MCARVADVMTKAVVTADRQRSLEVVAKRMLDADVGSVVITADGNPYGIVTESDIVLATYHSGRPLSAIPTEPVANHPLVTVAPDQPLRLAVSVMGDEQVKKLVVVDGVEMSGIITTQDLIDHYGELTRDIRYIRKNRTRRDDWLSEL